MGLENFRPLLVQGGNHFLIFRRHLDRRVKVLQADEQDPGAQRSSVRRPLNLISQNERGFQAVARHDFVHVHARQVTHDFPGGDLPEQIGTVFVLVNPLGKVRDLKLNRDADGDETDGRSFPTTGCGRRLGGGLRAVGHEEIFVLRMPGRPEHHPVRVIGFGLDPADGDGLNLFTLVAINFVHGPRQFQMGARPQHRPAGQRFAEAFEQGLFARLNENNAGGHQQRAELQQQHPAHRVPEEKEEPRLGNLKPELVIEGLRRRRDEALRLGEQADEAGVVQRATHLALHAGTINFKHQRREGFGGHQAEHHNKRAGHVEIGFRKLALKPGHGGGAEETKIRAQQQITRAGPEQPVIFQAGNRGGEATDEKQDEREQTEQRQRQQVLFDRWKGGEFVQPTPQKECPRALQEQQPDRETGHEEFLKLLPGALRREYLRVPALKQRRAAFGPREFVQFQFFQPLALFQPHLKPTHERHQRAESEKHRRHLTGQRVGEARNAVSRRRHGEQRQQIHQPVSLNVAFQGRIRN